MKYIINTYLSPKYKFIGNNTTNTIKSNGTNFERSTSHSDEIASPYNSVINTLNEKALSDDLKSEKDTKIPPQEGNLDKLFMNCFIVLNMVCSFLTHFTTSHLGFGRVMCGYFNYFRNGRQKIQLINF